MERMKPIAEVALFDEDFDGSGDRFSAAMSLGPALGRARQRIFEPPSQSARISRSLRTHAELWDHLVRRAYTLMARYTGGPNQLSDAPIALLAAGDLGRREFFPFSNLELIVLTRSDDRNRPPVDALRALPAFLESAGFQATVSVRSLDRADEQLRRDHSGTAELLEARFLAGDEELLRAFRRRLASFLNEHGGEHLTERVRVERERGCFRAGFRAVRTLDLEHSSGALRDVRTLFALDRLGRAVFAGASSSLAPWEQRGVASDLASASAAHAQLLAARTTLHLHAGARQDLLEPRHWPALAAGLRRIEGSTQESAEPVVQTLQLQCRGVFERLERLLHELTWRMSPACSPAGSASGLQLVDGLTVRDGQLAAGADDLFLEQPGRLLHVHLLSEEHSRELADGLILLSRRDVGSLAEALRADIRLAGRLREIFRLPGRAGARLRELDRAGVLCAALPEFSALQCRVRADASELQPLDQHAFQAVEVIDALERGEGDSDCVRLVLALGSQELLKIALLFHDIGSSDCNDSGTTESPVLNRIVERLDLAEAQTETVRFLIGERNSMVRLSLQTEQRRSTEVERLVERAGSAERLCQLFLFSVADMVAGERRAWSRWDLGLLKDLLRRTGSWSGDSRESMNNLSRTGLPPVRERLRQSRQSPRDSWPGDHGSPDGERRPGGEPWK